MPETERRFTAIVAMDAVGYSQLMQNDEPGAITRQEADHVEVIDPTTSKSTATANCRTAHLII